MCAVWSGAQVCPQATFEKARHTQPNIASRIHMDRSRELERPSRKGEESATSNTRVGIRAPESLTNVLTVKIDLCPLHLFVSAFVPVVRAVTKHGVAA